MHAIPVFVRQGMLWVIAAMVLAGVGLVDSAEAQKRETIEWCNIRWEQTNDKTLPRVLLIGDSIVVGYSGAVRKHLKGKANVDMLATSKAISDPAFLKEIAYALDGYEHAVIHFNNGLHGWHVTDEEYEASLRECMKRIRELSPGAKLIWANTTPVPSSKKGMKLEEKRNGVVLSRNAIAGKVTKELGVAVNDLYGLVIGDLDQLSANKGNVHYNEEGKNRQGEAVARAIQTLLGT